MTVVAIVLAAGASTRLGTSKQLLPFRGETLLRAMVVEARAACDEAVAVLGANAPAVRATLGGLDVDVVENDAWEEGMASSIRAGVAWAGARSCAAALIMVADQPRLTRAHLRRLVDAHRDGARVVASSYGVVGVPAVFDRATFPRLCALRGAEGARRVLRAAADVVAIEWPDGARDIDTPDDVRFEACSRRFSCEP